MAKQCAHHVCSCDAADGDFCGAHCAEAAQRGERHPTCECGHIDCEEATMLIGGVHTTGA